MYPSYLESIHSVTNNTPYVKNVPTSAHLLEAAVYTISFKSGYILQFMQLFTFHASSTAMQQDREYMMQHTNLTAQS